MYALYQSANIITTTATAMLKRTAISMIVFQAEM